MVRSHTSQLTAGPCAWVAHLDGGWCCFLLRCPLGGVHLICCTAGPLMLARQPLSMFAGSRVLPSAFTRATSSEPLSSLVLLLHVHAHVDSAWCSLGCACHNTARVPCVLRCVKSVCMTKVAAVCHCFATICSCMTALLLWLGQCCSCSHTHITPLTDRNTRGGGPHPCAV